MPCPAAEASRLAQILSDLETAYGAVRPGLDHRSPWELLVATVLSAQCTDDRVNRVTPGLFARYPGPPELAAAAVADVEGEIRSIGLFRAKARSLVGLARQVVERHGGRVPADRAALEALPGVGRKTASVVLGQAFGVPAFAVDTHVARVCCRLGFSPRPEPREVERRVTALVPPERWNRAHLLLIRHGRATCAARRPRCPVCPVAARCPWPGKG
ncbi:MAG: endonuclease III [Deferrisomatales bacterium]